MSGQFALFCELWCISLLHFLWQAFVVAGFLAIALRLGKNSSSHFKYLLQLFGLAVCFVLPFANFLMLTNWQAKDTSAEIRAVVPLVEQDEASALDKTDMTVKTWPEHEFERPAIKPTNALVYEIACLIWLIGVAWFSLRIINGTHRLKQLRKTTCIAAKKDRDRLELIARRMKLSRTPLLRVSHQVGNAFVFGVWKPCVVMPACWMTELSPEMLNAVIAHELAHVRRYDLWANHFQRTTETFLFFHPAIWWISSQVTRFREMCCDQIAADVVQNRALYAKTLERVGTFHQNSNRFSLATNLGDDRMSLLHRVQNVLGQNTSYTPTGIWPIGVIAILIPILISVIDAAPMGAEELIPPKVQAENTDVTFVSPAWASRFPRGASFRVATDEPPTIAVASRQSQSDRVPTEMAKVSLPSYRVAPPDVLLIQSVRLVPRADYHVRSGDTLQIIVPNAEANSPIAGSFRVSKDGAVSLGKLYGNVNVRGLTIEQIRHEIRKHLAMFIDKPSISVSIQKTLTPIAGEHLIGPDGTINLGVFGSVYVAGQTLATAQATVEKHLSNYFSDAKIALDVLVYNSKFYYIICESDHLGDSIVRIPVTGNETVLDAVAQIGGLQTADHREIWISRPSRNGEHDRKLPVDFEAITKGANTETNYQLFPGDRVFISSDKAAASVHPRPLHLKVKSFNALIKEGRFHAAKKLAHTLLENHPNDPAVRLMVAHTNLLLKKGEKKDETVVFRTYGVKDLVTAMPGEIVIREGVEITTKPPVDESAEYDSLINLVSTTVAPDTWKGVGGEGELQFYSANHSIVVKNTPAVHDQIAELLAQLRNMQRYGVTLERRRLQISEKVLRKHGLGDKRVAVLSTSEAQAVLDVVQDDPHSRLFDPMSLFVLNGQLAKMVFPKKDDELNVTSQFVITDSEFLRGTVRIAGNSGVSFLAKNGAFILCQFGKVEDHESEASDFFLMKVAIDEQDGF